MLSVFNKKSALLALAVLAVSPAAFAVREIATDGGVDATVQRPYAYNVAVTGDADLAGWASKAIGAHGAFDVKPTAGLKFNFTKSGANGVTVTVSGSQNFSATATGTDTMQALWAAVDAAIVAAGKKYAVKPMFATTKLAFVRELSSAASEIYSGDLMLPTARAITGHGKRSQSPQWAPDGRSVYYTSYFRSGGADVFRAEIGGGVSPIATYKGTNTGGAVSPDGSRVALALSPKGTLDIYVASASGTGAHAIVSSTDVETSPCWSPDGSRIAYTGGVSGRPQIMIVPASGGASRKVSTGGYSSEPAWNPVQTNQIAYTQGNCAGIGVADLGGASFSVPSDEKGRRIVEPVSHPAWCADGRHLVVTIGSGKVTKLGLLDTQSGKLTVISGAQFGNCSDPATRIAK